MSGLAVVVAGAFAFLVGSSLTPDPAEPAGRSVAIGAPDVDLDEDANDAAAEVEASTTTSTTSDPPVTTLAPVALSTTFSDWDSTLTWVTERSSGPILVRLPADAAEPERYDLPRSAGLFAWNATATLVAYVENRVLYVGPPGAAEPLAIAVQSLAWHETDGNRIAWTTTSGDVGNRPLTITTAVLSEVGALVDEDVSLAVPYAGTDDALEVWSLLTWGDEGFILERETRADDEVRSDVVLLFADGSLRRIVEGHSAYHVGAGWVATIPSGDGASLGELLVVGVDGEERFIALEPGMEVIAMRGAGESWVAIGPGDTVTAVDGGRISALPIEVVAAAWSADGEFLVVVDQFGDVELIEVATGEVVATTNWSVGEALWNLRIHPGGGE